MDRSRIKRVVIVGGGTAGWMAAAALSKVLGKVLEITLIESDAIGTVGVGEATIPPLLTYNNMLGLNEPEFLSAVKGTFKLGIAFENWTDLGHRYIHSFGITGKDHWTAGFQHFWLRGKERGLTHDYGDYCLELRAAEESKFAHLPKLGLNYAYHIDASAYASFLRTRTEEGGVRRIEGRITRTRLEAETGFIKSVELESGESVEGDLFLDCSGFRGLLIEEALHTGYDDWSHWLPCDRAVALQTAAAGPPVPYTRSIAHGAGWQWRIPLQHRTGNGHVYCSRYLSDDEATDILLKNVEGKVLTEPRLLRFRTGTRRRHWNRNCVAIGLSSGFIEPLESTSIHLIQRAIQRLMRMFPHNGIAAPDVAEFNAQMDDELTHIRDFIILHYHVTNRADTEFWRQCRLMDVPESLRHRLDLFRETGRVFRSTDELFTENSWTQVMLGQGVMPQSYHPIADVMSEEEHDKFLAYIRENVNRTIAELPTHHDYIARYCAAKPPAPAA